MVACVHVRACPPIFSRFSALSHSLSASRATLGCHAHFQHEPYARLHLRGLRLARRRSPRCQVMTTFISLIASHRRDKYMCTHNQNGITSTCLPPPVGITCSCVWWRRWCWGVRLATCVIFVFIGIFSMLASSLVTDVLLPSVRARVFHCVIFLPLFTRPALWVHAPRPHTLPQKLLRGTWLVIASPRLWLFCLKQRLLVLCRS